MKTALGWLGLALLTAAACSTPVAPDFNIEPSYLSDVNRGWDYFTQGNYSLATASFRSASSRDLSLSRPEAQIGLGWSLAFQDSLQKSLLSFNQALSRSPSKKDSLYILSGLTFVYRDITPPDYQAVRDNALAALKIDPKFIFDYQRSINVDDLNAVLAEAYFNLGQYTEAAAVADPDNTLDPTDPDYNRKLLDKINQMLTSSRQGG